MAIAQGDQYIQGRFPVDFGGRSSREHGRLGKAQQFFRQVKTQLAASLDAFGTEDMGILSGNQKEPDAGQ
jgi:hypothetical protein